MLGKLDPFFILYTKITQNKSKPKYKCETYKILRRTHRENLHDIEFDNDFLDIILKVFRTKEKKPTNSKKGNKRMGENICKYYNS